MITREFPEPLSAAERLGGDAKEIEDLTLERGELGREDLDGARATQQRVAFGEAEQPQALP